MPLIQVLFEIIAFPKHLVLTMAAVSRERRRRVDYILIHIYRNNIRCISQQNEVYTVKRKLNMVSTNVSAEMKPMNSITVNFFCQRFAKVEQY